MRHVLLKSTNLVLVSPLCCRHNCINHLNDSVQSGVRADCHVGPTEVVIDGADHPHDVQGRVLLNGIGFDQTWKEQAVGFELVPPVCPGFCSDSGRLLSQLVVKTRQGEKRLSSAVLHSKISKIEPGLFDCQYFLVLKCLI